MTFNEGLSAKALYETYSMEQATPDTEPVENSQDKAVRSLYAEILNSLIGDLKRGHRPELLSASVRHEVIKNRELALDWIYARHESTLTLDECLFILNLCKSAFMNWLKNQGLLDDFVYPEEAQEEIGVPLENASDTPTC